MAMMLVVDDEPSILKLCQMILRRGGHETLAATSGEEALRVFNKHRYSVELALLDVMMPGMNGIELAGRIRLVRPGTKIVLMSGYSPREILPLIGAHSYRVIWKPFQAESLLQMIENASDDATAANV